MLRFAVLFGLGTWVFHRLTFLPDLQWLIGQLLVLLLAGFTLWLLRVARHAALRTVIGLATAALLGTAWSHAYALWAAPAVLPSAQPRFEAVLTGRVSGLPEVRGELTRFVFATTALHIDDQQLQGNWRFRLSWRDAPRLAPGDRWTFQARLRHMHGYASPGAWDYEGWLYHRGIRYVGYVVDGEAGSNTEITACCDVNRLRDAIRSRIEGLGLSPFANGVVRALVVADRSGLSAESRALFRDTGTSHLMAVSGLHIGLISGGVMWLLASAWRRAPRLCERVPARMVAAGGGLVAAAGYAALAGFGLPTQRAMIMLAVLAAGIISRRETHVVHGLALAGVLVLLWHPPSIIAAGFWLSFGAVAAIVATLVWTRDRPRWLRAILVQIGVSLGLWPILLVFDLPASMLSPLVNLVLVPLFGLAIVPWSLIGGMTVVASVPAAALLLTPLGTLLDGVQAALALVGSLAAAAPAVPRSAFWAVLAPIVLLLLPPGMPLRLAGLPLLLVPWLPRHSLVDEGDFHVHLLDVGQGLSIVVETRNRVLVYDTGPGYPSGFTTASAVIVPFLRQRGRSRIDRLVISHGDNDHSGGARALKRALPVGDLLGGEPARTGLGAAACASGQSWEWDGVQFRFLHPDPARSETGNNASCVLQVKNPAGRLLLTGDIEASVENRLVRDDPGELAAEVVVAAHHGSRSSSTQEFIDRVAARHVLFAAGWANRYGFPNPQIVGRWVAAGAHVHATAQHGTLGFVFGRDGYVSGPTAYRPASPGFWRHDAGSATPGLAVLSGD